MGVVGHTGDGLLKKAYEIHCPHVVTMDLYLCQSLWPRLTTI